MDIKPSKLFFEVIIIMEAENWPIREEIITHHSGFIVPFSSTSAQFEGHQQWQSDADLWIQWISTDIQSRQK